jgi:Permuted papain-like amidase enzyme, YaeF/YiiX, C92 family
MAQDFGSKKILDKTIPKLGKDKARQNYEENIRPHVKSGDLFFFSGDHWLSGLIRWRSKSAWSHVGMVVKLEEIDRVFLVESILEVGVRMIPLSFVVKNYDGKNNPYAGRVAWARHQKVTEDDSKQLKISILEQLSKQYDGREFTRVAWRSLVGREKLFKDHKYTCSELIHHSFREAKLKIEYERGFFISPGSVWRNAAIEMMGLVI